MTGTINTIGYALATLGPALGIGLVVAKTLEGTARQPEVAGALRTYMFIGAALIEALGLRRAARPGGHRHQPRQQTVAHRLPRLRLRPAKTGGARPPRPRG